MEPQQFRGIAGVAAFDRCAVDHDDGRQHFGGGRRHAGRRDDHVQLGLDIVGALSCSGFEDIASNILNMLRQRVTGDYLQTSAILDRQFDVVSAVNDINDYQGPGTGYRISAERWAEIKNIAGVVQPGSIE